MEKYNIILKVNNEVISSLKDRILTFKKNYIKDDSLKSFTFISIINEEMLNSTNKSNSVNFENLIGICQIKDVEKLSLSEMKNIIEKLSTYDFVEYAYIKKNSPMDLPVQLETDVIEQLVANNIPDFNPMQGFKDGITPNFIGIDIEYAWSLGITGQNIQIADIEHGFDYEHVNLKRKEFVELTTRKDHHGTAVAGIMFGNDIGSGIKGMVHGADKFYALSELDLGRAHGITIGLKLLKPGDVFVYEMQTRGFDNKYVPVDFDYYVWEITQEALKAGIIVIAAAGNGNANLDSDVYFEYRNRDDNGIIRVGAGNELLYKTNFSTFGSMVHLQGWGAWNIVTTGYGDLYDDLSSNKYTRSFSGTSSATPIVASAAVAVQSWFKKQTGDVLTPHEMRALLIKTGTPQNYFSNKKNGHIGPIPNVRNAINELKNILRLSEGSLINIVIDGSNNYKRGEEIVLSAEQSISKVGNIVSYFWKLPDGLASDSQNQSILNLKIPNGIKINNFSIFLTVKDSLGNSASINHTIIIDYDDNNDKLAEYPIWERNRTYLKYNKVNWKNKIWEAAWWSFNDEPGLVYDGKNTGANPWKEIK
ncbi:S8 family peptidase [Arsenophonus apicola]|uniref:S8 family peptidase n=1 Tax=Arsenophonus apicola TaxID=2879119 RepID=UPI0038799C9E